MADDNTGYKVGDRLPKENTAPVAGKTAYRPLNWDELLPSDWDPMKPIRGLDLAKLKDSDPAAIEALAKVREAWNDAPIVPALNGIRVEIPGFVVPLDIDRDSVKEFLLVPYFGACIHVPPPPSNQVIHVVSTKPLSKEQQKMLKLALLTQGAVSVSGVIETRPSDTSMGFSSYRMNAEIIEKYIRPEDK